MVDIGLRNHMFELKEITESLIVAIKKENSEKINKLFVNRQEIINKISEMDYSKEEFKEIADEIKLVELFNELNDVMTNKKNEVINNISKLRNVNTANSNYLKNSTSYKSIFSKKV